MKYELRSNARYSNDEELLDDLRSVAKRLGENKVSSEEYDKYGRFNNHTLRSDFRYNKN